MLLRQHPGRTHITPLVKSWVCFPTQQWCYRFPQCDAKKSSTIYCRNGICGTMCSGSRCIIHVANIVRNGNERQCAYQYHGRQSSVHQHPRCYFNQTEEYRYNISLRRNNGHRKEDPYRLLSHVSSSDQAIDILTKGTKMTFIRHRSTLMGLQFIPWGGLLSQLGFTPILLALHPLHSIPPHLVRCPAFKRPRTRRMLQPIEPSNCNALQTFQQLLRPRIIY